MTPPDDRLQRALDEFLTQGKPFVLPDGPPPTVLLSEPPGGLPTPMSTAKAVQVTPASLPRPSPRQPAVPVTTLPGRAVVSADAVLPWLDHVVWSISADGTLVYLLGGAVERVLGFPAEYFLDHPAAWTEVVPAGDRPALIRAFRRATDTGGFVLDHRVMLRDKVCRVQSRGRLVRRPDGRPFRIDGTTAELPAVVAELEARLAAAEERLRAAGRMEALGRLAAGVAHDFNNCLTVISGNVQLIRDVLPPGDPLRDRTEEVVSEAAAASAVARQLMAFGRPVPTDAGPVCPNTEVRGLERLLRRVVGHGIGLDILLAPGVHPIPVGAGAFTQVVLNLVANARDATPPAGTITLRTAETTVSRRRAGRFVAVTVTDTGVGMSAAVRQRMFEPYFSTKGADGTGVGLATVADVVAAAGGHIEVESAVGWGTSVRVFFPFAEGPPPAVPPVMPADPPRPATVLLVLGPATVRDLAGEALQYAGYRVLEAEDADTGEERARMYAGPIDLLVVDLRLTTGDGPGVAAKLRAARPGLKVLFVSGSGGDAPGPLLRKPYTPADLLAAVRRALDGG